MGMNFEVLLIDFDNNSLLYENTIKPFTGIIL